MMITLVISSVALLPTMIQVLLIPVGRKEVLKCDGKHGGTYLWKGHDFTLILPPDCTDEMVTFTLEAYLPSSTQEHCLVSAVFDITADIKNFKRPVTIRFPHWIDVKSEEDKSLNFLVCHDNYYEMKKGYFEDDKSFGSIQLSSFCLLSICKDLITSGFVYIKLCLQLGTHQTSTSMQSQKVIAMPLNFEERITSDTTSVTANNRYLDLLILPNHPSEKWRIYCIAIDNPTYLQVIV